MVGDKAVSAEAVGDAHGAYKPAAESSWNALIEAFTETRAQALGFARELKDAQAEVEVPHNDIGPLSVGGWLRYLRLHATFEGRKIKPR